MNVLLNLKKVKLRRIPFAMLFTLPSALFYYAMARHFYKKTTILLNKIFEQGIVSGYTCEIEDIENNKQEINEEENNDDLDDAILTDCD